MAYPPPYNLTTPYKLMNYANSSSGGVFYILVPISLFVVILLYLKNKGYATADCGMAASFVTSLVTTLLFFIGGLSGFILFWTVVITFTFALWGLFAHNE